MNNIIGDFEHALTINSNEMKNITKRVQIIYKIFSLIECI